MASRHPFLTVDVFTDKPLRGNPVAVVLDADDVDDTTMQRVAAWTNLSETTFVCRPTAAGADYRVRIFTPRSELAFAGHPTIGTAHAVLETHPGAAQLTQECGAGLLPVRIERTSGMPRLFVRTPPARVIAGYAVTPAAIARATGAAIVADPLPLVVDIGPRWLVARVEGEDALRSARPDAAAVAALTRELGPASGVTLFAGSPTPTAVRSFAPLAGVAEDPVCGSGNAAVAAYLAATGLLAATGRAWVASQGREVGRDGTVAVRVGEDGAIEIGGNALTVVRAELLL
jgi:PhzF family phenazine biosynthesis protein